MKRNLIIAFGFLFIASEYSDAQVQCNIPCWQQSFPYVFCDPTTDNVYVKCSTNPNADGTPVKAYIPGCVTVYGESSMDTLWQPQTAVPIENCGTEPFPGPLSPPDRQTIWDRYINSGPHKQYPYNYVVPPWDLPYNDFNSDWDYDETEYQAALDQFSLDSSNFLNGIDPTHYDQSGYDDNAITSSNWYFNTDYAWLNEELAHEEDSVSQDSSEEAQWLSCDSTYRAQNDAGTDVPYVQPWNDAQADSDAQHALDNWLGVCQPPIQPDGPNCCIHVYLDQNGNDFGDPVHTEAETIDDSDNIGVPKCGEASCADVERFIRVNTSPAFLYQSNRPADWVSDPAYRLHSSPTTMWYTTPTGLPGTYEGNGSYEDHSFFELIEHEMGHWFGLMHPEAGPPDAGRHFSCPNCYTENPYIDSNNQVHAGGYWTVMAQGLNFAGDTSLYLTSEDSCQFKKLYCPQDLSIKLGGAPDGFNPEIFPNPTTGACQLQYELLDRAFVQVAIYDVLGNRMRLVSSGYEEAGTRTLSLGTESLPSGHYVCRVRVGDNVAYINLVIKK